MHSEFARYFVDPHTKAPLSLEIVREEAGSSSGAENSTGNVLEGWLVSSTARYPIVNGIPRFVDHRAPQYAASFGYQWTRWPSVQFESRNIGKPMEGYTRRMWEAITGMTGALTGDHVVLDIGCGPGRFIDVARMKGAKVIGLDYSLAVDAAAAQFAHDPNVCICQADALNLPIATASVHGAFSIGVLHHTPQPSRGVEEAARVVAPGGWLAIAVYGKGGYYDARMVNAWRRVFARMWDTCGYYPPLLYTYGIVYLHHLLRPLPFVHRPVDVLFPSKEFPDLTWSLVDTFDSVTPSYQSAHECHEVFAWLKQAGLSDIEPTRWGPTSFRGIKPLLATQ
jgi:SAM-dependent methyltransferase